ncbi:precorrin-3B synthase [Pseudaminobacter sp. NGMCC 1.201702]|uniref:precorrin-3B synthase n=1 Tax=Pseudaminobacter sp. NGMCC 1.201702 TaxID=3391825 RepID=UPI0039EE0BBC
MSAFSRRGACPALSRPMHTGDGLLVRLNPVAGGLSPNILIGLGESALRHGNGIVEVTARGSLQIRGLTAQSASLLAAEVDMLGIAVRTGVPAETGPLAGLDPQEISNPVALVERIRQAIETSGLENKLGPKVSVVVDGGGQLTMNTVQADVRLVALADRSWLLAVAGDASTAACLGTLNEDDACDAALAILRAIAERGHEARARDLSSAQMRAMAECPPRLDESRNKHPALTSSSPIGILAGAHGKPVVGVGLPFGSVHANALISLCRQATSLGAVEIRLAQQRALLVLGLSSTACAEFQRIAASLGFIVDADDPRRMIMACPGAPACASGHIAARNIAEEIARGSGDMLDAAFFLHVSGCAKGCAHPGTAPFTLIGGENGRVGLVFSATARSAPIVDAPSETLVSGLSRMAAALRKERRSGETPTTCLARLGSARIAAFFQQGDNVRI